MDAILQAGDDDDDDARVAAVVHGNTIIAFSDTQPACVWHVGVGQHLPLQAVQGGVSTGRLAVLSADGASLLVARTTASDTTVLLYDTALGVLVASRPFDGRIFCSMTMSADGQHAAAGTTRGCIIVWAVRGGTTARVSSQLRAWDGDMGMDVACCAFSHNADLVVLGYSESVIVCTRTLSRRWARPCGRAPYGAVACRFAAGCAQVLAATYEGAVVVYDSETGNLCYRLECSLFAPHACFIDDTHVLFSGASTVICNHATGIATALEGSLGSEVVAVACDARTGLLAMATRRHQVATVWTQPVTRKMQWCVSTLVLVLRGNKLPPELWGWLVTEFIT
jgi:hypothetical protein